MLCMQYIDTNKSGWMSQRYMDISLAYKHIFLKHFRDLGTTNILERNQMQTYIIHLTLMNKS